MDSVFILGRTRKITKEGRKSMITYKGNKISLTEARVIERELSQKSHPLKAIAMHSAFDGKKGEATVQISNNAANVGVKLVKTWNFKSKTGEEYPVYSIFVVKNGKQHTAFQSEDVDAFRSFFDNLQRKRKASGIVKDLFANSKEQLTSWIYTDPSSKTASLKKKVNAELKKLR